MEWKGVWLDYLAQDRHKCLAVLNKATNFQISQSSVDFLTS